jgi:hypothetical protein
MPCPTFIRQGKNFVTNSNIMQTGQVHYRPKIKFCAFLCHKLTLKLLHQHFWHVLAISCVAVWKQLHLIQCFAKIR